MNKNLSIKDFSTHLFWDVDVDKFDLKNHKAQLTYKVVEYGQLSDWKNLLLLYGEEEVKSIVLNLRTMDKVTLAFLANYFEIEEKDFRCYTQT